MTGSLQKKHNKYYVVLNFNKDGKRTQKWINTNVTEQQGKKEAERQFYIIMAEYQKDDKKPVSDILFSDYVKTWLDEANIKVDIVTYDHYKNDAYNHIIPYFEKKNIKLVDVKRETLQQYFNLKYKSGRLDGKGGLSAKTLRHHKNVIYQTCTLAVINDLIPSNPCEYISLPKMQRLDYQFYSLYEMQNFLEAIKGERLYPLILTAATFGLRRSEALGIKWDSIDIERKTLTIRHTVSQCNIIVEKDKTKTECSFRSYPLDENVINMFISLKLKEKENKALFGRDYIKNDYVFKWDNGKPYRPDYITNTFPKILKKYGFRHIRFHDLRHSCGSILNEQNRTLKDIQEWLGHADIQTTANIYTHLNVDRKKDIANAMSVLVK